ncbi:hypothetical protein POVWA2_060940 [Plasmodium ovale wallikeri]|uniref:Uncharacterized protein n=1 Tax=Plasmodium ovale wallikeri TaxID=864142 RepID=A0A1A9A2K6_PLAOA|nr:hypothetical protein POVWA1_061370 [Plasmodium ovale wallikeri]SBT50830.1 hypothetical protein POVWA2_060940 [Plasmodium ovale wallikeri]
MLPFCETAEPQPVQMIYAWTLASPWRNVPRHALETDEGTKSELLSYCSAFHFYLNIYTHFFFHFYNFSLRMKGINMLSNCALRCDGTCVYVRTNIQIPTY